MWPWRSFRREASARHSAAAQKAEPLHHVQMALLNRAHQQAAVAALGQQALTGVDISTLLEHATMFVAQTLTVEFVAVQQFDPASEMLRTVASCGIKDDLTQQMVDVGPRSLGRRVFDSAEPVIVRNTRSVTDFEVPHFLRCVGAVSGLSLLIPVASGPWGILHAYCKRLRTFDEDDFHFLQSVANVISTAYERRQAEEQSAKLAAFARHNPNPILEFDPEGRLTYSNEATASLLKKLMKAGPSEILPPNHETIVRDCLRSHVNVLDLNVEVADRTIAWSYFPIASLSRVHAYAADITERVSLEAQLRQSQKMEAIGQLAAGVAHDFNNILTIMQGLARKLASPECDHEHTVEQLFDTTERAAALTRQLLAFSRRQVIQRRVIDVREVVNGTSRMLQRLIGEDIVLTVANGNDLPCIEGDPSMLEQILMNLAVNSRDAMPRGGQLIISTEPVVFPDDDGIDRTYVCVQVQDTGCGMTEEVKQRIFEPFFTTKDVGKGTGLGLATVFGIIKQHSGMIEVESHVGRGTTFSILLPATEKTIEKPAEPGQKCDAPASGTETILLVEDEPLLRELAEAVLSGAGYTVLQAGASEEAFSIWRDKADTIDLLVTDLVLPGGVNGRDLASRLQQKKPDLKVIYTTGYSSDAVEGLQQVNFLQKPYPPEVLTKLVRTCLDS